MDADWILLDEAKSNHGVVTRRKVRARGITDRMLDGRVRKGLLERVLPGTFVVSAFPDTYVQRSSSAVAWLGDDAILHGISAAVLLGLEGVTGERVHVWTPRIVGPRGHVVPHRMSTAHSWRRRWYQGLPIPPAEQIFADTGYLGLRRACELVLDDLLRRRMTTLERVRSYLEQWQGHGSALARSVLAERTELPARLDSWLEKEFARFVRRSSLPMPLTQQRFIDDQRCIARVDFLYPWASLVIEVDGYGTHGRRDSWERDLRRTNELVVRALRVLRYSAADLRDRQIEMAEQIRTALAAAERSA